MPVRTEKKMRYLDKLNYCPYCFNTMDMDNLAYELVFIQGLSDDDKKTLKKTALVAENDTRRTDYYGKDAYGKAIAEIGNPTILLEGIDGKNNGLLWLCESFDQSNRKQMEKGESENADRYGNESENVVSVKSTEGAAADSKISIVSYIEDQDGIVTFLNSYRRPVMRALACCPHCHMRLPVGWRQAESFGAVSLMGPLGSGKTTILLSMMGRDWEAFRHLYTVEGRPIYIAPAHYAGADQVYDSRVKASDKMCIKGDHNPVPKCPDATPASWTLPVFIEVEYDGHSMIIGIYDNAGENLESPDPLTKPYLEVLLNRTFADIYLFEPDDMNLEIPKEKKKIQNDLLKSCKVLDLSAQGKLQKSNKDHRVPARDLLSGSSKGWGESLGLSSGKEQGEQKSEDGQFTGKNVGDSAKDEKAIADRYKHNTFDVYRAILKARQRARCLDHMKDMYFLGVIVKCDILQEVDNFGGDLRYDVLFERTDEGMTDIDQIEGRSQVVQELLRDNELLRGTDLRVIGRDYGKGQTWHCVSALGCDAEENGPLLGEYDPIRIAEPLVTCIMRKLYEEGWVK